MAKIDIHYHDLLRMIKDSGYNYTTENRPDITCKQISSITLNIDLREGFPAVTTKKLYWKGVVVELIWFLRGYSNIKFLLENDVHIWDKDAYNYYLKMCEDSDSEAGLDFDEFILAVKSGAPSSRNGYEFGDVGKNYGAQWRRWNEKYEVTDARNSAEFIVMTCTDQIEGVIHNLKKANPISRRHIVTAWNPAELHETALPPCHWAFELLPRPLRYFEKIGISGGDEIYLNALWQESEYKLLDKELNLLGVPKYGLDLKWHQRSVDTFLGLPFNIASYGILTHLIGALTDMAPMAIIGDLSNVHIYEPHMDAVNTQLTNSPMAYKGSDLKFSAKLQHMIAQYKEGEMDLGDVFEAISVTDFLLEGYESFGSITAEMFPPKE